MADKGGANLSGQFGLRVQLLPEIKLRPYAQAEVTKTGKGTDAGQGGYYAKRSPGPGAGDRPTEGVKEGQLYYRAGQGSDSGGGGSSASDDDGPDDDNTKGGLIRKVKGPKPKGSKDDGKIKAQRGEFVIRKSAVKQHGVSALNALNSGRAKIVVTKPAAKAPKRK